MPPVDEILYKDEFDSLAASCSKIKVIHVISDEEKEGYKDSCRVRDGRWGWQLAVQDKSLKV